MDEGTKRTPELNAHNESPPTPDLEGVKSFRLIGYTTIIAVFGIAITQNDFAKMWIVPHTRAEVVLYMLRIVLFAELAILALSWIIATDHELDLWSERLQGSPVNKKDARIAMLGLGVILGLLLALAHNPIFVSIFFTGTLAFNCWTQRMANDYFSRALKRTRASSSQPDDEVIRIKVIRIMERYWLSRPQLGRIFVMTLFSVLAVVLALIGTGRYWFQVSTYLVLILDIFVGETMIALWRHERDQSIKEVEQEGT